MAYNAAASSGSNLGPLNPALVDAVKGRIEALRAADPGNKRAGAGRSGDGLGQRAGPAHQPAAAEYQVARVAKARGLTGGARAALVDAQTARPQLGFLGEPRVNVLELNLALDGAKLESMTRSPRPDAMNMPR